ncbi:hypothetical protein [Pseudoteredinibacter isoporae]|uniref:Uncharacterized protein n=1 Tax=Pseudoteredinibacter isoporae TaxID=570281 RepID=A0A7X0JV36_9GAMM|nr:hypothetical protein [Pseudoteredinibacter isoporae]MBB6521856.1 hypothetical protein [Pseudoteredinibacter isoporae]NHO87400.1 hypothetical protein [Pseudoteredinibacter isoporae]NIB22515.1 hypothetical protein [Pseudoteredinibacter isoporae]
MFVLTFSDEIVEVLIAYISLYIAAPPDPIEVKEFIEKKCTEKDLERSFSTGLITKDELCSFILGHVFTKFILNKGSVEVVESDVEEVRVRLLTLFFS